MFFNLSGRLVFEHNKESAEQTPKEFFDHVFFKIFFDDPAYLLWVGNSPFAQIYGKKPGSKQFKDSERKKALSDLHAKINNSHLPDASIFPGGPADNIEQATSGQINRVLEPLPAEEYYFAWFGLATGVTVKGGYILTFSDTELVNLIAEGWVHYRKFLTSTPAMNGNQINTFNAHWLMHRLSDDYNPDDPFEDFNITDQITTKTMKLETPEWVKLIFALAKKYGDRAVTVYVCKLGQMNTTIGFVKIILKEVNREYQVYNELFSQSENIPHRELETVYKTEFSFKRACMTGALGCRELQPEGLSKYFESEAHPLKKTDENSLIEFRIYLAWITTMLNNKDLNEKARKMASALVKYRTEATHGKSDRKNLIEKGLFAAKSRNRFIEALTDLLNDGFQEIDAAVDLKDSLLELNTEKFRLFTTLLKFEYTAADKKELT